MAYYPDNSYVYNAIQGLRNKLDSNNSAQLSLVNEINNLKNQVNQNKNNISSSNQSINVLNQKIKNTGSSVQTVSDPNIYGVTWDGSSNSNLTRTDSAKGLVAGVNGNHNDFDNKSVYSQMKVVYDGSGNKFIRIPAFYIYKYSNGSGFTWKISLAKQNGPYWYKPKAFYDYKNKTDVPYVDVGAYIASDNGNGGLASKSGRPQLNNININQFRNKVHSMNGGNNDGYQLMDVHVMDLLQVLFTVEFATLNSQSILNDSGGDKQVNTGDTDNLHGSSNISSNGTVNYRGIENLWGYYAQFVDGINFNNNQIWVCDNPNQYQSDVFAGAYHQVGYNIPQSMGEISSLGFDKNNLDISMPTQLTSNYSFNNYFTDMFGSTGVSAVAVWAGGGYAAGGLWYLDADVASSDADPGEGSRLIKHA